MASSRPRLPYCIVGSTPRSLQPRSAPTAYEKGASPFTILCIGTLHEVKGQTYLIEACRLLQERGIDFVCRFVADGPDLAKLTQQAVEAGISARVHFLGRVTAKRSPVFSPTPM